MSETTRRRYGVAGRVQGVGFRMWTVRQGRELGLRGIVRNHGDGWVEVEAEGAAETLDRLEALLRRGPALARVSEVRALEPTDRGLPAGFDVSF